MGVERFKDELFDTKSPKLLCVLVIDVLGSNANDKMGTVNEFLNNVYRHIHEEDPLMEQLELAILQHGSEVEIVRRPCLLDYEEMPPALSERGNATETVLALEVALQLVSDRKEYYRSNGYCYYRPWVILISDGEFYGQKTSEDDIEAISMRIAGELEKKRYRIAGIGVGDDFNMEVLEKMIGGTVVSIAEFDFSWIHRWT